jgi:hypothetical protein
MRSARFAWGVAHSLVWTGALVIGAAALVSMVTPSEADKDGSRSSPEIQRADGFESECETTKVRMQVAEGFPYAHYSLCDGEGNEVIRVMYSNSGRVAVTWGDRFAVRAGCWAVPGGTYDLTVVQGEIEYRLQARPGLTSGFRVANRRTNERDGLGITPGGWIVRGPSILD